MSPLGPLARYSLLFSDMPSTSRLDGDSRLLPCSVFRGVLRRFGWFC